MLRFAVVMGVLVVSVAVPALAQPMGGPPPEAFAACDGKDSGAECSHPTPNGTMNGACQRRGDKLQCVPSRPPGGGGGRPALDERGNETGFPASPRLTFDTIPVPFDRLAPASFILPSGETHWYEVVYLPQGGVNWTQAKALAEQAGGYLATLHSTAENDFVFALGCSDNLGDSPLA